MLQRAASNAYSWWWASHIRTKQSKWLEQNLQDMEDKVQIVLKLIEEDGDSFAKRAEMYYKKRPELISFVEESYRAYRALAERYDHISTELQNANSTIATVFPERVQFPMDDEEEFNPSSPMPKNNPQPSMDNNIPKVPNIPTRDLKGLLTSATKQLKAKKPPIAAPKNKAPPKSGLSKAEAIDEIDRLQKEILALQTVKEFVKSSYESGLKKHWEIENQITDLQERVFSLQDEFKVGKVIEDDEARTLMAEAALRSCEETLTKLLEKQEISTEKARAEGKRIDDALEKVKTFKKKLLPNHHDEEDKATDKEEATKGKEKTELDKPEMKKIEEVGPKGSLTVTELVEKIDELVCEVISLETAVSSQTALTDRLRIETDDLQAQIQALESDKEALIDHKVYLTNELREMEEKLKGVQKLNQNFENENKNVKSHFHEARSSLDFLSEKLHIVMTDEEVKQKESLQKASVVAKALEAMGKQEDPKSAGTRENDEKVSNISVKNQGGKDDEGKVYKEEDSKSGETKERESQIQKISVTNQIEKGEKEAKGEDKQFLVKKEKDTEDVNISVTNPTEKEDDKVSQSVINSESDTTSDKQQGVLKLPEEVKKDGLPPEKVAKEKDDELNWQEMLLNGLEDRENVLLTEYTTILRNFKEVKKKLNDVEKKKEDSLFEMTLQLREQKVAVARRDQEIRSLRQKLNLLQDDSEDNKDLEDEKKLGSLEIPDSQKEEVVQLILINQSRTVSPIEERLRTEIDALLDENLDFWLRFSTSFHQIQKYRSGYQDLQAEITKVKAKTKSNKEANVKIDLRSDLRPIYRHLTEIQTELAVWIDQSALLKDELQRRFSSLCHIQEEISTALTAGAEEEEMRFTSHEAAKFQGEVVNMKQENNKVRDELEAGLEHVTALQSEIKTTIAELIDELGLSGQQRSSPFPLRHSASRSRVPLRSFIFGSKPKKKSSIFSCMHPRRYQEMKAGLPM